MKLLTGTLAFLLMHTAAYAADELRCTFERERLVKGEPSSTSVIIDLNNFHEEEPYMADGLNFKKSKDRTDNYSFDVNIMKEDERLSFVVTFYENEYLQDEVNTSSYSFSAKELTSSGKKVVATEPIEDESGKLGTLTCTYIKKSSLEYFCQGKDRDDENLLKTFDINISPTRTTLLTADETEIKLPRVERKNESKFKFANYINNTHDRDGGYIKISVPKGIADLKETVKRPFIAYYTQKIVSEEGEKIGSANIKGICRATKARPSPAN